MRRGKLRVAVPATLYAATPDSGNGLVWHNALGGLRDLVDLRPVAEPAAVRSWRKPDVWLSYGHQGPWASSKPRVAQIHEMGWLVEDAAAAVDPEFIRAISRETELALANCERVLTPVEVVRRQVITTTDIPPECVDVVPYGVDTEFFHPGIAGGAEVIRRAGGDPDRPYVLFAAVLYPRKNLAAVRDAVAGLARRGFPHQLVVAGGPAIDRVDSSEVEQEATAPLPGAPGRLVRVHRPSNDELAALMAGASALCLPSFFEGFGFTVLEAMACGTPVVVSDRGALPEVVGDAGIVATVYAHDVEAALAGLLGDPETCREYGKAGRARAEQFTWARTVQGWFESLERAAAM